MPADILIVGQGLAGTVLGWEFERAGVPFEISDAGHATSASRIAAGILNPITGRRIVKSWEVETLLPIARETYQRIESKLGMAIWHELRIRRLFVDDRERRIFAERQARGELAPFAGAAEADGFWINGAGRVDLATLLSVSRKIWSSAGKLREERVEWEAALGRYELVIDCAGATGAKFETVPWEYSKGEILTLAVDGLEPGVGLNRGHWMVPTDAGHAKVGATHEPGCRDMQPSPAARVTLEASATALLRRPFEVTAHDAGVRVNLPDRRPVAGRHPTDPRLGLLNGLGAKGALLAPWLARQWVNHLTEGVPFLQEIDVSRFSLRRSSQALSP